MPDPIRIATRQSPLALWQANEVLERMTQSDASTPVELLPMTTKADRWLETPLSKIGGKGLFVKELEQSLYDMRADLAVHSMKDVTAVMPEGLSQTNTPHCKSCPKGRSLALAAQDACLSCARMTPR